MTDERSLARPRVLLAILAKPKDAVLPFYLTCLDALDYPKSSISLYIRTDNGTSRSADILKNWVDRVGHQYGEVYFEPEAEKTNETASGRQHVPEPAPAAAIRQQSLEFALRTGCEFYFAVDIDNFLRPDTLSCLIGANLPIVAPLLLHEDGCSVYSNYFETVDANGYFVNSDAYYWLLGRRVKGLCQVPVVLGTYLVRRDVIPFLSYEDGSARDDFVVFSDSARRRGIPQYLDNREIYGYLTPEERTTGAVERLGEAVLLAARKVDIAAARTRAWRSSAGQQLSRRAIFIHSSWRTSSTWFWSKFRELPETLAFYEPFTLFLSTVTRRDALGYDRETWPSGHPKTDPYYLEYVPLIGKSAGVRLYRPEIAFEWFIPFGGINGALRDAELKYLSLLVREAQKRARIPVFGFCRSLGRAHAIRKALGGHHLFLFRNLWSQWESYIAFSRRDDHFFLQTAPLLGNRADDPFLADLARRYMRRGKHMGSSEEIDKLIGTPQGFEALASLPEHELFGVFMGLHVYLYLHANKTADVTVDVTRMARNDRYRQDIEHALRDLTGLPLAFADVRDESREPHADGGAVDWREIIEVARSAACALEGLDSRENLTRAAEEMVESAAAEAKRMRAGSLVCA